jgi:undecaprenyl-diphosphatase
MFRRSGPADALFESDVLDDPTRTPRSEPAQAVLAARRRLRWADQASLAASTLGAVGAFLAVSRTVQVRNGNSFDRAVMREVGRARHPFHSALARGITFFGSAEAAIVLSITMLSMVRRRPRLVAQVAASALGGATAELGFKRMFRRARPTLLEHLEDVSSTSFPSGHAAAAASLYLTLAFLASRSRRLRPHRREIIAAAGVFAASIGATRVYLGVHWPTDVLGGLALGTAWACVLEAGFDLAATGALPPRGSPLPLGGGPLEDRIASVAAGLREEA